MKPMASAMGMNGRPPVLKEMNTSRKPELFRTIVTTGTGLGKKDAGLAGQARCKRQGYRKKARWQKGTPYGSSS